MLQDLEGRADLLRALLWRLTINLRLNDRSAYADLIEETVTAVCAPEGRPWLDARSASRYSGCSISWLTAARSKGTGPAFYRLNGSTAKGSRVYYRLRDLDVFLARNRVETRAFIPSGGSP